MSREKEVLYILLEQNSEVSKRDVYLSDVAKLACANENMLSRIKGMKLLKVPAVKKYRQVFSIIDIIREIQKEFPCLEVRNLGETDFIITYVSSGNASPVKDWTKTLAISIVLGIGSAFSIMTFNNDVDVTGLFAQMYQQLTGQASNGFTLLELSYSIGLAVGIIVFFNHFMGKKLTMDPTPIEVQMKIYEEDINRALVDENNRKGKGGHAGTGGASENGN